MIIYKKWAEVDTKYKVRDVEAWYLFGLIPLYIKYTYRVH